MKACQAIAFIFLISTISCRGQLKNKSITNTNTYGSMEKFDIARFKKNNVRGEFSYVLKDGNEVREIENVNSQDYTVETKSPLKPNVSLKLFYMQSGNLKATGEKFYAFPIGTWQYFSETGALTKETNWDSSYQFTLEDLSKKMLKSGIDIYKVTPGVSVHRASIGAPLYIVSYPINPENPYDVYELRIDGITGETKEKTVQQTRN